jgi:hypothetical protein
VKTLLRLLAAFFALEEETYCDGCRRYSRGVVCPYC